MSNPRLMIAKTTYHEIYLERKGEWVSVILNNITVGKISVEILKNLWKEPINVNNN